jgi:peptide/nickel transport system permease protein
MKKINYSFWLGAAVIGLLVLVVLFPSLFTNSNPYGIENIRTWVTEGGNFHIERAPFSPQTGIPLGTDAIGRDIWSLIIYGSRLTLLLAITIVIARFCIALPLGLSAGFGSVVARSIITQFAVIFSAIPALLISIIVLNMDFFVQLDKGASLLAFTMVLTVVGWGKLGLLISERVEMILKEPYIAGDYAIGKNRFQMTLTTVIPHLLPELVVLFFLEFARALAIIMQLGIFNVFVGNVKIIEDTDMGTTKYMNISYEPEWASMLGAARQNIRSAPWTVWYPAIAFFVSVLGLNLFGEGIRSALQSKSSSVGNGLGIFRQQNKVRFVSAFVLLILIGGLWVNGAGRNLDFHAQDQYPQDLVLKDGSVVIGTENARIMADYIGLALKDMGLSPLDSESYSHPYTSQSAYYPHSSQVQLQKNDLSSDLQEGKDYSVFSFGDYQVDGLLTDYRTVDLYNLKSTLTTYPVKGKNILLDATFYTPEAIRYFSEQVVNVHGASSVIWSTQLKNIRQQQMGDLSFDGPALFLDAHLLEGFRLDRDKIYLEMISKETSGDGDNIMAYRPGDNPKVKEEALIYGFGYNALDQEEAKSKVAFGLEMTKQLLSREENKNRTIIIVFFDGSLHEEFLGQKAFVEEMPYDQKKQMLFVDMTRIDGIKEGQVIYSVEQSPISRYFAYSFSRQMVDRFESEKIVTVGLEPLWKSDMLLYLEQGTPTLVYGLKNDTTGETTQKISSDALGRYILETITFNNY